jgi:predicted nuclease of restriction endonuclease-like (RecB) superfamily
MATSKANKEFENIVRLIKEAQNRAYKAVNTELVLLYYNVGKVVSEKVGSGSWGEGTVDELAKYIAGKLPGLSGFNRRGLYRMKQFFEVYTVEKFVEPIAEHIQSYLENNEFSNIVSASPTHIQSKSVPTRKVSAVPTQIGSLEELHQQFVSEVLTLISWTNHLEILSKTKTPEEKFFYMAMTIRENWSMRELRRQLSSAYFERSMLSRKAVSATRSQFPPGIFKDPYIFEFLDLPDRHSEKDLEKALSTNLKQFILEIGKGFTYMGSQFRLQVGNKDYHADLIFYHRDLQCLVLFELKIEEFEPEFLGKLNFYLEALDRDVKRPHENPSIGVLLCKGKDSEVVEYSMARNISPAMIADNETMLIPKNILAKKLNQLTQQLGSATNE